MNKISFPKIDIIIKISIKFQIYFEPFSSKKKKYYWSPLELNDITFNINACLKDISQSSQ